MKPFVNFAYKCVWIPIRVYGMILKSFTCSFWRFYLFSYMQIIFFSFAQRDFFFIKSTNFKSLNLKSLSKNLFSLLNNFLLRNLNKSLCVILWKYIVRNRNQFWAHSYILHRLKKLLKIESNEFTLYSASR